MNRVMAHLFRSAVVLVGYAVASLAASAFLNVVLLAWAGFTPEETRLVATSSFVFSIPFVALFIAYLAFLPSAVAIVVSEIAGKRDWLFHALAGAIVAMVVIGFRGGTDAIGHAGSTDLNFALVAIGAGMCGGIGYWAVAGRGAGGWRSARADDATSPAP